MVPVGRRADLVAHLNGTGSSLEVSDALVLLDAKLQHVQQLMVVEAPQHDIVRPLLAVVGQRKQGAIRLPCKMLQARFSASLKWSCIIVSSSVPHTLTLQAGWSFGPWPTAVLCYRRLQYTHTLPCASLLICFTKSKNGQLMYTPRRRMEF